MIPVILHREARLITVIILEDLELYGSPALYAMIVVL